MNSSSAIRLAISLFCLAYICRAEFFVPKQPENLFETNSDSAECTINPLSSPGALSSAIESAVPGDVICLDPGQVYSTANGSPFILPNKNNAGSYITIRIKDVSSLPSPNTRLNPANVVLPQLQANGLVLSVAPGASYYRIRGVEFRSAGSTAPSIVHIGVYGSDNTTISSGESLPSHIIIDQCYMSGTAINNIKKGIIIAGDWIGVVNSHFEELLFRGASMGIEVKAGSVIRVVNNFIASSGYNVFAGSFEVATDIEIRGNVLTKLTTWDDSWKPYPLVQLSNAERVLVDGNVLENSLHSAVILSVANPLLPGWVPGINPSAIVQDIIVSNNTIQNCAGGLIICSKCLSWFPPYQTTDKNQPFFFDTTISRAQRILVRNNLFLDIIEANRVIGLHHDNLFVDFIHNTFIPRENSTINRHSTVLLSSKAPKQYVNFKDNIFFGKTRAITGDFTDYDTGFDKDSTSILKQYLGDQYLFHNGLIGTDQNPPSNTFQLATVADVNFDNKWLLQSSSPWKGIGSDGADLGIGSELYLLIDSAKSGIAPPPYQPMPPTIVVLPEPTSPSTTVSGVSRITSTFTLGAVLLVLFLELLV